MVSRMKRVVVPCAVCGVNVYGNNDAHVLDTGELGLGVVAFCPVCWHVERAALERELRCIVVDW